MSVYRSRQRVYIDLRGDVWWELCLVFSSKCCLIEKILIEEAIIRSANLGPRQCKCGFINNFVGM